MLVAVATSGTKGEWKDSIRMKPTYIICEGTHSEWYPMADWRF
jgi:hypothetical protein